MKHTTGALLNIDIIYEALSFTDSIVNQKTVTFARLVEENFKDEELESSGETITRKTRFSAEKLSTKLIFVINYLTL